MAAGLASADALNVLRALKTHNVLLVGPPSTGKTILLNEIRRIFEAGVVAAPTHAAGAAIPFPKVDADVNTSLPAPKRTDRKGWYTTFHQDYQYKQFVVGQQLDPGTSPLKPIIAKGLFVEAADHARKALGTSLLIIDEVNRGNAARIFGDMITVLDIDKRLGDDDKATDTTLKVSIPLLGAFEMPRHVYILASMNTADVSVAPLDLAFRRRFREYYLYPDTQKLAARLGVTGSQTTFSAGAPKDASEVKELAVRLLAQLNGRIEIAAGRDYALGHGFFWYVEGATAEAALAALQSSWPEVQAQIEDMFRSDQETLGAVLQALPAGSAVGNYPFYFEHKAIEGSSIDKTLLRRGSGLLAWDNFVRLAAGKQAAAEVQQAQPEAQPAQPQAQPAEPAAPQAPPPQAGAQQP